MKWDTTDLPGKVGYVVVDDDPKNAPIVARRTKVTDGQVYMVDTRQDEDGWRTFEVSILDLVYTEPRRISLQSFDTLAHAVRYIEERGGQR